MGALQAAEIHAQAAPAPGSEIAGLEEAQVPDQAQLRRTASAPMAEVAHSVEAFTAGTFTNAIILGVNAAFQQGQVNAGQACWLASCILETLCSSPRPCVHIRAESRRRVDFQRLERAADGRSPCDTLPLSAAGMQV